MGLAVSRGTSHVTAKHHCKHFSGCYKNALCKNTVTHSVLHIRLERNGFLRNQRTALYSWNSEAHRTYLEIRHSTIGHINEDFKKITIHTDTQMITNAALKRCAQIMCGLSGMISSLHINVQPPELEINPPKMVCGCLWGGVIKTTVISSLIRYGLAVRR